MIRHGTRAACGARLQRRAIRLAGRSARARHDPAVRCTPVADARAGREPWLGSVQAYVQRAIGRRIYAHAPLKRAAAARERWRQACERGASALATWRRSAAWRQQRPPSRSTQGAHRAGHPQGAREGLHERGAARVLQAAPARSARADPATTPTTRASICARTRSPPTRPTARRSKRNTRSSCAPATANASCSRRSKSRCA